MAPPIENIARTSAPVFVDDHPMIEPLVAGVPAIPGGYFVPDAPGFRTPAPLRLAPPAPPPTATPNPWKFFPKNIVIVGASYLASHIGWSLYEAGQVAFLSQDLQVKEQDVLQIFEAYLDAEEYATFESRLRHDNEFYAEVVRAYGTDWDKFTQLGWLMIGHHADDSRRMTERDRKWWVQFVAQQRKILAESYCRDNPDLSLASCYLTYGLSPSGQPLFDGQTTFASEEIPETTEVAFISGPKGGSGPGASNYLSSRQREFKEKARAAGFSAPDLEYVVMRNSVGRFELGNHENLRPDMKRALRAARVVGGMTYPERKVAVEMIVRLPENLPDGQVQVIMHSVGIEVFSTMMGVETFEDPSLYGVRLIFRLGGSYLPINWTRDKIISGTSLGKKAPALLATKQAFEEVPKPFVTTGRFLIEGVGLCLGTKVAARGQELVAVYFPKTNQVEYLSPDEANFLDPSANLRRSAGAVGVLWNNIVKKLSVYDGAVEMNSYQEILELEGEIKNLQDEVSFLPPLVVLRNIEQLLKRMDSLLWAMMQEAQRSVPADQLYMFESEFVELKLGVQNQFGGLRALYPYEPY